METHTEAEKIFSESPFCMHSLYNLIHDSFPKGQSVWVNFLNYSVSFILSFKQAFVVTQMTVDGSSSQSRPGISANHSTEFSAEGKNDLETTSISLKSTVAPQGD